MSLTPANIPAPIWMTPLPANGDGRGGSGSAGTVTSVSASGGTTGLTFSGGPITASGTFTLGGTLGVANGGTGATSLTDRYILIGAGTGAISTSVLYNDTSGRVILGNAGPILMQGTAQPFQVYGATAAGITLGRFDATASGCDIRIHKSRSAVIGGLASVASGDAIGNLTFLADDGVDANRAVAVARLRVQVTGSVSTGIVPGKLFLSTANASGALTDRLTMDETGAVLAPGTFSSPSVTTTGAIGFTTGAGGTVTQGTSKTTGVSLAKPTGTITTHAASLAAGTIVSFALTNSVLAADDLLVVTHHSGGTFGAYTVNGAVTSAGTGTIAIRNNTAGALAEALVLKFAVIKSVTA